MEVFSNIDYIQEFEELKAKAFELYPDLSNQINLSMTFDEKNAEIQDYLSIIDSIPAKEISTNQFFINI